MEIVAASIMCGNPLNLADELVQLSQAGVEWLHCDVMDGRFVNNLAMAPYVLEPIINQRKFTVDIHLACDHPEVYIEMFAPLKPDYLTFHYETTKDVAGIIQQIRKFNIGVGLAISPQTPFELVIPYLAEIDLLLVMTVEPGFAGQKFNWLVLEKLRDINSYLAKMVKRPLIQVDGNINSKTVEKISPIGANLYVIGTSALFNSQKGSYLEKVKQVKAEFVTTKEAN